MDEIRVKVVKFGDRKYRQMQYTDPITRKKKTRSTGETNRTKAERAAAKWEAELREGRYKPASKILWAEFRQRYEDEVLTSLAEKTDALAGTVFNSIERVLSPQRLGELSASRLSHYQKVIREGIRDPKTGEFVRKPVAEDTIASYLRHLSAALNWAVDVGLLNQVPRIKMPRRAKGSKRMKGRAISTEEFERMLTKIESTLFDRPMKPGKKMRMSAPRVTDDIRSAIIVSWERFLTGLWLSGLRLDEALNLWWDDDKKLAVDFSGKRPMFRIPAELEKGNRDRLLPMTPDLAEFLESTPEKDRTGPVFRLLGIRGRECRSMDWVSRIVSRIGEAAGVKVDTDSKSGKIKYASAHDLRRSFGHRWAKRVMPAVLKELMRHDGINTTMKYYAEQDAQSVAEEVWKSTRSLDLVTGNTSGNSGVSSSTGSAPEKPQTLVDSRLIECPLKDLNLQPTD
ncbi:MAG: tyrosine-type recombinase/integrase [Pirellulaceae bacterium]